MFRILWSFIAGIVLGIFLPEVLWAMALLGSMLVSGLAVAWLNRPLKGRLTVVCLGMVFAGGYVLTVLHTDRLFEGHFSAFAGRGEAAFVARLTSDPIERERSVKCEVNVSNVILDSDTATVSGKMLLYLQKSGPAETLGYGDEIVFRATLSEIPPPQNPNEFNYQRYMRFHQVSHQVYLPTEQWALTRKGRGLRRDICELQHAVIHTIRSFGINDRELAILSALVVGYKHYLSSDQVNAFASAGAMHVLAVSGLHVGIIYLIIDTLLKFMDRRRWGKAGKGVLMILVLWFYALLTGLSPSVTRAATMFTFVIAARQFGRHTDIFNTLASSAFVLLVFNPYLIVEVGFQLSYLAVLGIVLLQPRIYDLWQPQWWLLDKVWAITAVSLAAQAATFPLALLYFHQFPNYFLLSNLVVIPAATAILPVGIALVCLHWVPYVAQALGWGLYYMVHWLDRFIGWVEQLPFALVSGIDIGIFETYLIYMIVACSCAFLITRQYRWLWTFLFTLIVVEAVNIVEASVHDRQRLVVFYRVKGADALDFIRGRQHVFLADSALRNNFDRMRFHVHHHWWHRDLQEPAPQMAGWYRAGPWMQFDELRILALDSAVRISDTGRFEPDILYVRHRTRQHPGELLKRIFPRKVVLSTCIDWRSHRYWMKLCRELGIPVHSLREQGAYVAELE